MIRSIGAEHVLDYTRTDFTQTGRRCDLILDIPGNHSFSACRRALTPRGTYGLIGHDHFGDAGGRWLGSLPRFFKLVVMSPFVSQLPDLNFSMPGKITPVVDRTFPLDDISGAIRYLKAGQAQGKVVITVSHHG